MSIAHRAMSISYIELNPMYELWSYHDNRMNPMYEHSSCMIFVLSCMINVDHGLYHDPYVDEIDNKVVQLFLVPIMVKHSAFFHFSIFRNEAVAKMCESTPRDHVNLCIQYTWHQLNVMSTHNVCCKTVFVWIKPKRYRTFQCHMLSSSVSLGFKIKTEQHLVKVPCQVKSNCLFIYHNYHKLQWFITWHWMYLSIMRTVNFLWRVWLIYANVCLPMFAFCMW